MLAKGIRIRFLNKTFKLDSLIGQYSRYLPLIGQYSEYRTVTKIVPPRLDVDYPDLDSGFLITPSPSPKSLAAVKSGAITITKEPPPPVSSGVRYANFSYSQSIGQGQRNNCRNFSSLKAHLKTKRLRLSDVV